ncbi:MAG: ArnT family glycosyltransferase, partial [Thermodesulfobacteriota bacterium]
MRQRAQGDWRKWTPIVLLLGFCFLFYFLTLDRWELRKPDEIRYARVAQEMVEGGDWVSLQLYGRPYLEKPPLFFWLMALSSYLWQGFTSFSARFPSALFGTLTVLIVFLIGKDLFDSRTGFLSSLILATSFLFARFSARANIDATLTFFTTASLFCFLRWYQWDDEKKKVRGIFLYAFYIAMGLATLTKGPIGFILPLLVSLVYLVIRKDWKGIKGMRILSGMFLFLVIVLSWYLPAVFKGGRFYLDQTLIHRNIGYYSEGWMHSKP